MREPWLCALGKGRSGKQFPSFTLGAAGVIRPSSIPLSVATSVPSSAIWLPACRPGCTSYRAP